MGMAQPVSSGDVYVLDFHEEVLRGCVDKMAVQIGSFPGVGRSLAYIPEALSITRFWARSSVARESDLPGRGILSVLAPAPDREKDGWTSISPHLTTTKCHVV
jgi:hypothetical protein